MWLEVSDAFHCTSRQAWRCIYSTVHGRIVGQYWIILNSFLKAKSKWSLRCAVRMGWICALHAMDRFRLGCYQWNEEERYFAWCRKRLYCPLLDDGRIYLCAPAHYSRYYNKVVDTRIPPEAGIDIHSTTAREIMLYLVNPSFTCAWCAEGCRKFAWKSYSGTEDWYK